MQFGKTLLARFLIRSRAAEPKPDAFAERLTAMQRRQKAAPKSVVFRTRSPQPAV